MSNLFSELNALWSARSGAQPRKQRRSRLMTSFHVLHDINYAAPWDEKREIECTGC